MTTEEPRLYGLPPKERTIIPPEGGWEPSTYYVVEVSCNATNLVHRAIFYSGFLNGPNKEPGGYNVVWNATYELGDQFPIGKAHYLKVICKISEASGV